MRNGSDIFDHVHFEPSCLQRTDRGFSPRSGSLYIDLHLFHAVIHRRLGCGFRCHLRGERRAFTRAFEALDASARPGNGIATDVSNRYQCVIKGGTNVRHTRFNIFSFPLFRSDSFLGSQSSIPPFTLCCVSHRPFFAGLCESERLFLSVVHAQANPDDDADRDTTQFQSAA